MSKPGDAAPGPWVDGTRYNGDPEWIFADGAPVADCGMFSNAAMNLANVVLIIEAVNSYPSRAADKARIAALTEALLTEQRAIANEARRIASFYEPHSDGRNTFIILAEWIDARAAVKPKGGVDETT